MKYNYKKIMKKPYTLDFWIWFQMSDLEHQTKVYADFPNAKK